MKVEKIVLILALLLIITFSGIGNLYASTGVGIILGEPTGLSLRFNNFPIFGIAWSFNNYFHVHCDYWFKNSTLAGPFLWYIGAGGKVLFYSGNDKKGDSKNGIGLGIRVPFGLQIYPIKRLEIFAELVPGMILIPSTDVDLDAGIGIRFYFN